MKTITLHLTPQQEEVIELALRAALDTQNDIMEKAKAEDKITEEIRNNWLDTYYADEKWNRARINGETL